MDETSTLTFQDPFDFTTAEVEEVPALALLWSLEEPDRAGEVLLATAPEATLGRGDRPGPRMAPIRQRPGENAPTGPLRSRRVSRDQLRIRRDGEALQVQNTGRCPLLLDGQPVDQATARLGSVLELKNELVFLVCRRPARLTAGGAGGPSHPFGRADDHGLVGESPAAWRLREQMRFLGPRPAHVLVTGESGTGKELVGQALHALSDRAARPVVSRNAATIPEGILDAELFGNVQNYPNPGTPERRGLIGEAHRSSLLLDEFAELPEAMQAHLLRVLDAGEYHRLGDARARTSNLRLIALTNRPLSRIKHDVGARLPLRLQVPGLNQRPEDVPLIARHLLRRIAAADPDIAQRYFDPVGRPRMAPRLITQLVRRRWTTHVRELEGLLWRSMLHSAGSFLDALSDEQAPARPPDGEVDPSSLTRDQVVAALDACGGVREQAWRALGLRNRHQLKRLLKKHGLSGS